MLGALVYQKLAFFITAGSVAAARAEPTLVQGALDRQEGKTFRETHGRFEQRGRDEDKY